MSARDFAILMLVCTAWALNAIVSKIVIGDAHVPPLLFAAARFALVTCVVFPWLRPIPRPLGPILIIGALMGAGMFGLGFIAMKTASPSAVGVVSQISVPMLTLLSVAMLGERLTPRRSLGTVLTLAGAVIVMWAPQGVPFQVGLLFVVLASLCGALGTVLMKQVRNVRPLQFQAWVAVSSLPLMVLSSLLFEQGQVQAVQAHPWTFFGGIAFNGLIVSALAHTTYYWLIRRYDTSLLGPLTLVTPLLTIGFGVWLTDDPFSLRLAIGCAVTLIGVLVIALRPQQWLSLFTTVRKPRS